MEVPDWECTIQIDFSHILEKYSKEKPFTVEDAIKSMVEFWSGHEAILEEEEGNYTTAFLRMIARSIFYEMCSKNYSLEGIIARYDDREGWYKMDGSEGFKIISVDEFRADIAQFHVQEIFKK